MRYILPIILLKTPKECYEQIIADLTDAEQYAPDNDNSTAPRWPRP